MNARLMLILCINSSRAGGTVCLGSLWEAGGSGFELYFSVIGQLLREPGTYRVELIVLSAGLARGRHHIPDGQAALWVTVT